MSLKKLMPAGGAAFADSVNGGNGECSFRQSPPIRWRQLWPILLAALLVSCVATKPPPSSHYLAPGHPDGIALLAPPPAAGSGEAAADLATARAVFKARTDEETARAIKDESISFDLFKPAIGPVFQLDKLPKTDALLQKVKVEIADAINIPKNHWKRLRPYQLDPELSLRKPESSASYPSGHSTRGTVYALVLAELFPDKQEAILAIGRDIGWDRVLIGKHFPTDVVAGRVLGQAIVRELHASEAFQRDFAAAKAEVQAAQH